MRKYLFIYRIVFCLVIKLDIMVSVGDIVMNKDKFSFYLFGVYSLVGWVREWVLNLKIFCFLLSFIVN